MLCPAHPWGDADGLTCTRVDVHATGHVYESSTGSDVPDGHTEGIES